MEEISKELEILANPLIRFLEKNYNPHCKILIDNEKVVIMQDVISTPIAETKKAQSN